MPNLGEILRKALPQDIMSQVEDAVGDDFDWDVVPRTRLNKVIAERNSLRNKGTQLSAEGDNGLEGVDLSGYVTKEESEKAVEQAKAEAEKNHDSELLGLRKRYAAVDELRKEKVIDPDLILNGGLIDISKMDFDDTGALKGLSDAVKTLKENKAYLFEEHVPNGTGKEGSDSDNSKGDAVSNQINDVFERMGISLNNSQEG